MSDDMFDNNLYETPLDFFNRLDAEFAFDIDAAAESHTAKCREFYTKEDDVLSKSFKNKTIFLNPPYTDEKHPLKDWYSWAEKQAENGCTVVVLTLANTETAYFHDYLMKCSEIRLIRGRIWFLANGKQMKQTRHNNLVAIWRPGITGPVLTSMKARV